MFSACREGDLETVKFLVENKADITAENNYAVRIASENGHLEIVKFLLENKADITANNNEPVQWASGSGHLEIVKFLLENKADITANNNDAVQWASGNGRLEIVKFLVENKADITANNNEAVRYASVRGHLETVSFLLENKADIGVVYGLGSGMAPGQLYESNIVPLLQNSKSQSILSSCLSKIRNGKDSPASSPDNCCCVCRENQAVIVLSCGHKNLCCSCFTILAEKKNENCPICRDKIIFATRGY